MFTPSPYNLIAEIDLSRKTELLKILSQIDEAPETNPFFRFHELKEVHFGRLVVVDEVLEGIKIKYPAYLVLSTNYDGTEKEHLENILAHEPEGVDTIFSFCKAYPGEAASMSSKLMLNTGPFSTEELGVYPSSKFMQKIPVV